MTERDISHQQSTTSDAAGSVMTSLRHPSFSILEVWKEYEKIAVHFNELIIRLRSQSLGVVAALATLVGVILHETGQGTARWNVMAAAFLCLIWVTIWILDFCYLLCTPIRETL